MVRMVLPMIAVLSLAVACSSGGDGASSSSTTDEEFRQEVVERFGMDIDPEPGFLDESEQAFLDPGLPDDFDIVDLAKDMCAQIDWPQHRATLGDAWDDSFDEFVAQTYCPSKL